MTTTSNSWTYRSAWWLNNRASRRIHFTMLQVRHNKESTLQNHRQRANANVTSPRRSYRSLGPTAVQSWAAGQCHQWHRHIEPHSRPSLRSIQRRIKLAWEAFWVLPYKHGSDCDSGKVHNRSRSCTHLWWAQSQNILDRAARGVSQGHWANYLDIEHGGCSKAQRDQDLHGSVGPH